MSENKMSTETKPKKIRKPKSQTAPQLMATIQIQPLTVKVELVNLLKVSIEEDAKALKSQLALIDFVK